MADLFGITQDVLTDSETGPPHLLVTLGRVLHPDTAMEYERRYLNILELRRARQFIIGAYRGYVRRINQRAAVTNSHFIAYPPSYSNHATVWVDASSEKLSNNLPVSDSLLHNAFYMSWFHPTIPDAHARQWTSIRRELFHWELVSIVYDRCRSVLAQFVLRLWTVAVLCDRTDTVVWWDIYNHIASPFVSTNMLDHAHIHRIVF